MMDWENLYIRLNRDGFVPVEIKKGILHNPYVGKKGKLVKILDPGKTGRFGVIINGKEVYFQEDEIEIQEE